MSSGGAFDVVVYGADEAFYYAWEFLVVLPSLPISYI